MSFFLLCLLVEIIFHLLILTKHFGGKNWPPLPLLPTGHSGTLCFFAGFSFKCFVFSFAYLFFRTRKLQPCGCSHSLSQSCCQICCCCSSLTVLNRTSPAAHWLSTGSISDQQLRALGCYWLWQTNLFLQCSLFYKRGTSDKAVEMYNIATYLFSALIMYSPEFSSKAHSEIRIVKIKIIRIPDWPNLEQR